MKKKAVIGIAVVSALTACAVIAFGRFLKELAVSFPNEEHCGYDVEEDDDHDAAAPV